MRDFKKSFFLFKKHAHAQQAGYFVQAEKPLHEKTPLPDQRTPLFFHFQSTPPPLSSGCLCKANSEFYGLHIYGLGITIILLI